MKKIVALYGRWYNLLLSSITFGIRSLPAASKANVIILSLG